jgi:hypothetical protein
MEINFHFIANEELRDFTARALAKRRAAGPGADADGGKWKTPAAALDNYRNKVDNYRKKEGQ